MESVSKDDFISAPQKFYRSQIKVGETRGVFFFINREEIYPFTVIKTNPITEIQFDEDFKWFDSSTRVDKTKRTITKIDDKWRMKGQNKLIGDYFISIPEDQSIFNKKKDIKIEVGDYGTFHYVDLNIKHAKHEQIYNPRKRETKWVKVEKGKTTREIIPYKFSVVAASKTSNKLVIKFEQDIAGIYPQESKYIEADDERVITKRKNGKYIFEGYPNLHANEYIEFDKK